MSCCHQQLCVILTSFNITLEWGLTHCHTPKHSFIDHITEKSCAHRERGKNTCFCHTQTRHSSTCCHTQTRYHIQAHVATPKHVTIFKDMLQHPNTCFCHSQTRYHIQAHAATPNTTVSCINHKIPQALVQI